MKPREECASEPLPTRDSSEMDTGPCPSSDELANFLTADGETRAGHPIQEHLAHCEACHELVAVLANTSLLAIDESSEPPREPALARGSRIGRYLVLHLVGFGAMGAVYAAYDPDLDRKVAVKLVRPKTRTEESQALLVEEARKMARVAHENVVAIYDVGVAEGVVFLAQELVSGISLESWLTTQTRSLREIRRCFWQLAKGLAAIHDCGLVHSDVKPSNVLITEDGRVRICDFGLAIDSELGPALGGTPAYMAPELQDGAAPAPASDQYSFGVMLHTALFGRLPSTSRGSLVLARSPKRASAHKLTRVLRRALRASPDERWPSMHDVALKLRDTRQSSLAMLLMVALFTVAAIVLWRARSTTSLAAECHEASDRAYAAVWNPDRARNIRERFLATGLPYAPNAAEAVDDGFERYGERWRDYRVMTCVDTSRRPASDAAATLRAQCLAKSLSRARTLVSALEHSEQLAVQSAPMALESLPDIAECWQAADSTAEPAPEQLAAIRKVQPLVEQVITLKAIGSFDAAAENAQVLMAETQTHDYAPLQAEAALAIATVHEARAEYDLAREWWYRAIENATAASMDTLVANAALQLAAREAIAGNAAEAKRMVGFGRAAIQRAGSPEPLRAFGHHTESIRLIKAGKLSEAEPELLEALKLRLELYGPEHYLVASTQANLGSLQFRQGRRATAAATLQSALAAFEASLGRLHPLTATTHSTLASVYRTLGAATEGLAHDRQAIEVLKASFHSEHPRLLQAEVNLAKTLMNLGRDSEAHKVAKDVLSRWQHATGEDSPATTQVLNVLGALAGRRGDHAEALRVFTKALRIREQAVGESDYRLTSILHNIGEEHASLGEYESAAGAFSRALAIQFSAGRAEHPWVPLHQAALGAALLDAGDSRAAVDPIERAREALHSPANDDDRYALALATFGKARITPRSNRSERKRLAESARTLLREMNAPTRRSRALDRRVAEWLRQQPASKKPSARQ